MIYRGEEPINGSYYRDTFEKIPAGNCSAVDGTVKLSHCTENWRTFPYGHLGSLTLREICEVPTHSNMTTQLTPEEIVDLLAYIQCL